LKKPASRNSFFKQAWTPFSISTGLRCVVSWILSIAYLSSLRLTLNMSSGLQSPLCQQRVQWYYLQSCLH
jgi:hypothetical protein